MVKSSGKAKKVPRFISREHQIVAVEHFQTEQSQKQRNEDKLHPISKESIKKLSHSQLRIHKSNTENIYLLRADKQTTHSNEQYWSFSVFGSKGMDYNVIIKVDQLTCTCLDYYLRGNICKHIYFIITQVAKNEAVLKHVKKNTKKLRPEIFDLLNNSLKSRLKRRLQKLQNSIKQEHVSKDKELEQKKNKEDQINSKDLKRVIEFQDEEDADCMICFLEMSTDANLLADCPQCKKYFHKECLSAWKTKSSTCPYCRLDFNHAMERKIELMA